jgi:hypothetical protein
MAGYPAHLLKSRATESAATDGEELDRRLHDSDGKQLSLNTSIPHEASIDWDDIPNKPNADLGLESTERRRAARALTLTRTRRKR